MGPRAGLDTAGEGRGTTRVGNQQPVSSHYSLLSELSLSASRKLIPFSDSESWFVDKKKTSTTHFVALVHWDPFVLYIV